MTPEGLIWDDSNDLLAQIWLYLTQTSYSIIFPNFFFFQSATFLTELESFASQYGFGLNGLKNLMKSILLISYT